MPLRTAGEVDKGTVVTSSTIETRALLVHPASREANHGRRVDMALMAGRSPSSFNTGSTGSPLFRACNIELPVECDKIAQYRALATLL